MSLAESLDMTPPNTSGWELIAKTGIGIVIGWLLAFLLFIILTLVGGTFTQLLSSDTSVFVGNPLFPLLLLIIAFVVTFVGNILVASLYNAFYSARYRNVGLMFRMTIIANVLLFIFFAPIYLLFNGNIDALFFIIGFHIVFASYLSWCLIEITSNPHYAPSGIIGSTMWVALAMLLFATIMKATDNAAIQDKIYLFLLFPPVLGYGAVPLAIGIWDMLYYRFYESGNDFFYIASPSHLIKDIADDDDEEVATVDDL